jgi:pilus assembly protein CpaE
MPIYILTPCPEVTKTGNLEQRIMRAIPDAVPVTTIQEFLEKIARRPTDPIYLLIVAPAEHHSYFTKLTEVTSSCRASIFFVLISDELSASDYKALVRRGDADWVSTGADPQEIVETIGRHRKLSKMGSTAEADAARPVAISFVPSAGGVGNTTLALEVAIKLKTDRGTRERRICLIDLDFQGSHVCDHLDIEPRLKIQEIVDNPERLDSQLFEMFVSRHASGLHVFAAPRTRFDLCATNVVALDAFFSLASSRYELMLIDLPSLWFSWTAQIIAASDGVIVTGVNSIPGLRQTVETLAAVRAAGDLSVHHVSAVDGSQRPVRIAIAINRFRRRFMGGVVNRQHVETVLRGEKIFYVGEEPAMLESINTGMPIGSMRTSGVFAREIAALASHCAALKPSHVTTTSRS